ncbi:hypothetical protein C8J57DRAFT_1482556 [Mycena rebaudengoi]|nr:hypothetical protein C8J57DRAFT_1482556 [Mycena rebaudengoi]
MPLPCLAALGGSPKPGHLRRHAKDSFPLPIDLHLTLTLHGGTTRWIPGVTSLALTPRKRGAGVGDIGVEWHCGSERVCDVRRKARRGVKSDEDVQTNNGLVAAGNRAAIKSPFLITVPICILLPATNLVARRTRRTSPTRICPPLPFNADVPDAYDPLLRSIISRVPVVAERRARSQAASLFFTKRAREAEFDGNFDPGRIVGGVTLPMMGAG